MKKLIIVCLLLVQVSLAFSQAKKPTLMIIPNDNWCHQNGFEIETNNQGLKVVSPDYERALRENSDLGNVITKINGLMADRGFPLKPLEDALKKIKQDAAESMAMTSKSSGSGVSENLYEKLTNVAKTDIIIKLGWTVTKSGFNKSIQINLEAVDSYTGKSIASQNPVGNPSSTADMPSMLSEAVLSIIDNFNARLQSHFDDLFANGREVIIKVSKFDSWDGDLEKEYEVNGEKKELSAIIEDWISKNTVKGRFENSDATENKMTFEQVRIPLYNASGKAIDCKNFCEPLQKYLQGAPFNIPGVKLVKKGIGQTWIILGEK
jgi:hypothetical protein